MIAHQPMGDGDLATPEHAIRNLLADLEAGEPYLITHGSFRPDLRAAARRDRRRLRPHGGIVTDDATSPVQQLLDIEEIKQLKARYFRLMDLKQWDDWGMVFAKDCVMEVPEADMVNNGREEIVTNVSTALIGARTCTTGTCPRSRSPATSTARGIWAMFDYVEWPAQDDGTRVGLQGYGHYREEYVREDGAWRIARSRLERLRVDPLD